MQKAIILILTAVLFFGCTGSSGGKQGAPATEGLTPGNTQGNPGEGASTGEKVVEISGFQFMPSRIEITPGTKVTWVNRDSAPHGVVGDTGAFDTGVFGSGKSGSSIFLGTGEHPYHCSVHPSMKGTVVVVESVK